MPVGPESQVRMGVCRAAAAPAVLLVILAACGGGDPSTDAAPPPAGTTPAVMGITPSQGILAGGTQVEVQTTGFATSFAAALPEVDFGGAPGTAISFLTDDSVRVTTPAAGGPGAVDVVVTSADLSESATLPGGFSYTAAPIVGSVSPDTGDPAGGEVVTVIGDNFDVAGPVTVTFGSVVATGVSVQGPTVLTCFTPANAPGTVTVTVTNPDTQQGVLPAGYTYSSAPTPPVVSAVSPGAGDPAGGNLVTITGANFDTQGVVTVIFSAWNATAVSVQDPSTLTCITPAAPPGPATVRVTNPDGGQGELVNGFVFASGPVVTGVVPDSGGPTGGDPVTVEGENFDTGGLVTVTFGAAPGTAVTVLDSSTLTCLTPANPIGPVDVTVTNPDARQGTLAAGFTYTAGPIVAGVAPGTGDISGGEAVTIGGSNFDGSGTVTVTFGLADATGVTVSDPSTIHCITPPGPQGSVNVTVTNPNGDRHTLVDGFIYTAAPRVTIVSPGSGHPLGGDLVTIIGSDFATTGSVTVDFGGASAASVSVIDAGTITCVTPPGAPGPATVTVTNPGLRQGSLVNGFFYTPDPTVALVSPSTGDEGGGELVTVTGSDFDAVGTVTVTFGAGAATGVSVSDPGTLTCLTPSGTPGPVTVTVTNPNGQQGSLLDGFTYIASPVPAPRVFSVNPSSGDPAGGDLVTVNGADFDPVGTVTVTFGAGAATGVSVQDPSTLTCRTPPGPPGPVTVTVTNPDLQQGSLVGGYTYTGADPGVIAMEDQTFTLINQERGLVGKPAMTHDPAIRAVARAHSEDMRDRNFFDHVNPDGNDYRDRLTAAGIPFVLAAEMIQWNLGAADPAQTAVDWWLNSPVHRGIMLDESDLGYTLAGVGCSTDGAGKWWFTVVYIR